MLNRRLSLIFATMLLASCGASSQSSTSSISSTASQAESSLSSTTTSIQSSSIDSSSSEESTSKIVESSQMSDISSENDSDESSEELSDSSQETLESSISESSQEESSSEAVTVNNIPWSLTYEAIPETSESKYNHNFDFEILATDGSKVGFHGNSLQRGAGSKNKVSVNNTIQVRGIREDDADDSERGYFYMTSGVAKKLTFVTLRNYVAYNNTDMSGTPTIYSADQIDATNGVEVQYSRVMSEDEKYYTYTVELPYAQFRFENRSSYAMYLFSFDNID